jgi:hypothetical protein
MRMIAIDWSGARSGARRKIWLAEWCDGEVTRLECGRSRDEIAVHDVRQQARTPEPPT